MKKLLSILAAWAIVFPALAGQPVPPFTEAVLPVGPNLYAVAIGPGGPGEEFGSDETNGGLYRIMADGTAEEIGLSDGQGLRNPTGLVGTGGNIVLVDGNQIISVAPDGLVHWRKVLEDDGVFLYDIEALNDDTLIVSDFGRGVFTAIAARTGEIRPYLDGIQINGLARFEVTEKGIYAVSWGTDDAWDSALYLVSNGDGAGKAELLSDGFGNLESVEIIDGNVVVGGYRGHKAFPNVKLLRVGSSGTVQPIATGSTTRGVSDMFSDGTSVWLTYFYDSSFEALPVQKLLQTE